MMSETSTTNEKRCDWCNELFEDSELTETDMGFLCDQCIAAIKSRGEQITIKD